MSQTRRRQPDPDPVVAARLRSITFADPYVFVHASDVLLEPEAVPYEEEPAIGGWVPPPAAPPPMAPPPAAVQPPATAAHARPRSPWGEQLRQRLEPARTGVAALVMLALIAVAIAGFVYLRAQPSPTAIALPAHTAASTRVVLPGAAAQTPTAVATALLEVDVTGKVRRPGVVRLRQGSRVVDAVRAAGGSLPGTSMDSLNLAAKLTDGQQVAVGAPLAAVLPVAGGPAAGGSAGAPAQPVDLNTATVQELQTLPGIGPVLAQRIIDYRTAHGPFAGVSGLQQVGGIGPSKFQQLKDHVST